MNDLTDQQLRDYAAQHSEAAFSELVRRHVDLVYSAARRLVRDPHLTEDVTQGVFVALARNARHLTNRPVLSGWLHGTARNLAAKTVRSDVRRRAREQEAAAMNELLATEPEANWEHIATHLDDALGELNESDRDALLLRYFENKSAREMAQTLSISDEAAQKRVSRAMERLREFFAKRGITIGASGLAVVISANAVQAAPAGLAVTISTAAALAGTTIAATTIATQTIMNWINLKSAIAIIAAALVAGIGTHLVQQSEVDHLRVENGALLTQGQGLIAERDSALSAAKANRDQLEGLRANQNELLRLRGEVGLLRRQLVSFDDLQKEIAKLRMLAQLNTTSRQETNQLPVVAKVVVTPIQQPRIVSEGQIRTIISIDPGDILNPEAISLSLSNLVQSGLFYNVRAALHTTTDGVALEFLVQERPKLTGIRFAGNTQFREADLVALLDSKVGGRLNERTLYADTKKLQAAYQASGFTNPNVKYVSHIREDVGEGEVTFEITE